MYTIKSLYHIIHAINIKSAHTYKVVASPIYCCCNDVTSSFNIGQNLGQLSGTFCQINSHMQSITQCQTKGLPNVTTFTRISKDQGV